MVYHEPVVLVYREPVERLFDSAQSHFCFAKMEPKPGIEPGTSSLPWKRSTTELLGLKMLPRKRTKTEISLAFSGLFFNKLRMRLALLVGNFSSQ